LLAAIQSAPTKWVAEDLGLTVLGTQEKEIAPQWPKHTFVARPKFLDDNPETVRAFEAGAHVFVEKPLAETAEDAERVVAVARKHNKKLVVGYSGRQELMTVLDRTTRGEFVDEIWTFLVDRVIAAGNRAGMGIHRPHRG
jgi:hypothetical protein